MTSWRMMFAVTCLLAGVQAGTASGDASGMVSHSWEPPRTTRRYVHPPMAERMCVLFNDAKILLSEVRHDRDFVSRPYTNEESDVCWFFHGADDELFDFRRAENMIPSDGVPLHGLAWTEDGVRVMLETCCDYVRRPTLHGRFSVSNGTGRAVSETYAVRLRHGNEATLLGGFRKFPPDYYYPYESHPETWADVVCDWSFSAGVLKSEHGGFMAFAGLPASARWDAARGELHFELTLGAEETASVDFSFGIGGIVSPQFEATRAETDSRWRQELAKISRLPAKLRDDPQMLRVVQNVTVQMLQCFCRPVGKDYVLPRQGGLQRWVWPWDNMEALTALGRLGDFGEYVEGAIRFYFELYGGGGYPDPKDKGRIGPFGNDWDCNTANVLGILSRYCLDTGRRELWDLYRGKALEGFRWIMSRRVKPEAAGGLVPGFFAPGGACDYTVAFQTWGFTDAVNISDLGYYVKAAERFGDPALAEIRVGFEDYLGSMKKRMLELKRECAGLPDFDIPITPDRKEVPKGFPRLYHGYMLELGLRYGYLDAADVMRVWACCLRTGQASDNGLTGNFSPSDPNCAHYWYTTSQDVHWHRVFRKIGQTDQAQRILDATLMYAMSREFYVGERYRDDCPWFLPWSPNCSGSGRIVQMLFDCEL